MHQIFKRNYSIFFVDAQAEAVEWALLLGCHCKEETVA